MRQLLFADRLFPVSAPPLERGFVLIESDRLVLVGRQQELPADRWGLDAQTFPVVTPGLVNLHTHLGYTGLAVTDGKLSLMTWIEALTQEVAAWTPAHFRRSAETGVAEAVRAGTTCVADTFFTDGPLEAAKERGLRGVFYQEAFGGEERIAWLETELSCRSGGPLQKIGLSPHTPFTLSAGLWRAMVRLAQERGLPLHGHLSESPAELEWALLGTGEVRAFYERRGRQAPVAPGLRPAHYLASIGGLTAGMLLAHGVQLDGLELASLAEIGVRLVHCPRSNRLLNCGSADTRRWDEAGLLWGIGTDSKASSGSLDLWQEARAAALLRPMPDEELLKRLTAENARCLGLLARIGTLEPGKQADVVACERLGGRVLLTMVAGRALYLSK